MYDYNKYEPMPPSIPSICWSTVLLKNKQISNETLNAPEDPLKFKLF